MRRFKELNLSEARRLLSALVREIEDDPATGYRITLRGKTRLDYKEYLYGGI